MLLDFFRIKQSFFFFNDTATTEIYTLSLHDALPISVVIEPRDRRETTLPAMAIKLCRVLHRRLDRPLH